MKLVDRINNLTVRNKLYLFLIIPVLTILFLSWSIIYLKYQVLQESEKTSQFIFFSLRLADLTHELQKERDMSAGFAGSKGKQFIVELEQQKKFTDEKLKLLYQAMDSAKEHGYWELKNDIEQLKSELQKIITVRNGVQNLQEFDHFAYYSNLNISSFYIIQHLQVLTSNPTLARYGDAFSTMLWLQERSGQERGELNGVFASRSMDSMQIKTISGYIADQATLLRDFYVVAPLKYQPMLRERLSHPTVIEVEAVRSIVISKIIKNDLLIELQRLIGYGGLIHNFKNYVLRGEKSFVIRFHKMHSDAKSIIRRYEELPNISQSEVNHLNIIKSTFEKYGTLLNTAASLQEKGVPAQSIDKVVKVNDVPALNALSHLHEYITEMDASLWWQNATFRLEVMAQVSDNIRMDITNEAQLSIRTSLQTLIFYFIITITSIFIVLVIGRQIMRRLVGELESISKGIHSIKVQGDYEQQLYVSGNDELSEMANAFNSLIKERRKSEANLILADMVFKNASEAIIVTDADNKIEIVNPAFTQITGYKQNEALGKNPSILQSDRHDKSFYQAMWASILQNGKWEGEIWSKRKTGEVYPEWLAIRTIVNSEGEIVRHIGMFSDISKRRQAEEKKRQLQEQLLQVQKMESLGHLTGGIAHDFNNILGIILGYTELALNNVNSQQPKLKEYLNKVYKAGDRAKELVAQMLAFSRGEKNSRLQNVQLFDVLNDSIKLLRPLLPSSIDINTYSDKDIPDVNVDPVQVQQLIMNLCINARDVITGSGLIECRLRMITEQGSICTSCHKTFKGEYVELSIRDTGTGIKSADLNLLFDPFFSTKDRSKGTGMGLAIVHGIMHSYHGHILLHSELDRGSTFKLLFPPVSEKSEVEPGSTFLENAVVSTTEISNDVSTITILIVDDEEGLACFLKDSLETYNYKVSAFVDSSYALQHFKENPERYDLVITDQTMPKITGSEMAREMLKLRPDLPIILCSGYSEDINKKLIKDIGIGAFLNKPVKLAQLIETINQFVK